MAGKKDVLWDCGLFNAGPFNIIVHNITTGLALPAAGGGAQDARTYWANEIRRTAQFPTFANFTENTTRLVFIEGADHNICIFTLKLIEDNKIVELYDFFKPASIVHPTLRGLPTFGLMVCLNEVRRLNPKSGRTLWLGTIVPTLVKHYMENGCFLVVPKELDLLQIEAGAPHVAPAAVTAALAALAPPVAAAQAPVALAPAALAALTALRLAPAVAPVAAALAAVPVNRRNLLWSATVAKSDNRLKEWHNTELKVINASTLVDLLPRAIHSISPLGTRFPGRGWSLIFPLSDPFDPATQGVLTVTKEELQLTARALQQELGGRAAKFEINLSPSNLIAMYENVMRSLSETGLVFGNTYKDPTGDTGLVWNGKVHRAILDMASSSMPTDPTFITLVTALRGVPDHITGHTHPAHLYALESSIHKHLQDLAPPSLVDLINILTELSPGHIVFSVECAYLIEVDQRLFATGYVAGPEHNAAIDRLRHEFNSLSTFSFKDNNRWAAALVPEYNEFKIARLGARAAGVIPNFERRLRAEFMVDKINRLLTLANGTKLAEVRIHCYPTSQSGPMQPRLSVSLAKPATVFNTPPGTGMRKIADLLEGDQTKKFAEAVTAITDVAYLAGPSTATGMARLMNARRVTVRNAELEAGRERARHTASEAASLANPANLALRATADANALRATVFEESLIRLRQHATGPYSNTVLFQPGAAAGAPMGVVNTMEDLSRFVEFMGSQGHFNIFTVDDLGAEEGAPGGAAGGAAGGAPGGAAGGSRKKLSSHSRRKRNKKTRKTRKH